MRKVKLNVVITKEIVIDDNELKCSPTCFYFHVPFGRDPVCEINPGRSILIKDGNRTEFCLKAEQTDNMPLYNDG